jgi:hypothetical protein
MKVLRDKTTVSSIRSQSLRFKNERKAFPTWREMLKKDIYDVIRKVFLYLVMIKKNKKYLSRTHM